MAETIDQIRELYKRERAKNAKLMAVAEAARKWWLMHRPCAYSAKDHRRNPCVNTCTPSEKRLALALAALGEK